MIKWMLISNTTPTSTAITSGILRKCQLIFGQNVLALVTLPWPWPTLNWPPIYLKLMCYFGDRLCTIQLNLWRWISSMRSQSPCCSKPYFGYLTWPWTPVISKLKLLALSRSVPSRSFVLCLVRLAAAIGSQVIGLGRVVCPPSPSKWWVAKYRSHCRVRAQEDPIDGSTPEL